jgi:hypothetical protein
VRSETIVVGDDIETGANLSALRDVCPSIHVIILHEEEIRSSESGWRLKIAVSVIQPAKPAMQEPRVLHRAIAPYTMIYNSVVPVENTKGIVPIYVIEIAMVDSYRNGSSRKSNHSVLTIDRLTGSKC